jgi:FMN phosphatase YigB (HAD superfamily)
MAFETYLKTKKAFVFGLDDVLYPKKDYLLQVYYLFAEFMSYTEQLDSGAMIAFMQAEYLANGAEEIFDKTADRFGIDIKYQHNFNLLHENARLPLKLLLYKQVLALMQEIVIERKELFILVDGNPVEAINKIKQMEWNGLEGYLKVYFTAEFEPKPSSASIDFIVEQHALVKEDMVIVGDDKRDESFAAALGIEYFSVTKLL